MFNDDNNNKYLVIICQNNLEKEEVIHAQMKYGINKNAVFLSNNIFSKNISEHIKNGCESYGEYVRLLMM